MSPTSRVLIVEPFYGGSHKVLIDLIVEELETLKTPPVLVTLPAKKWHWRARTSALYFAQNIPVVDASKEVYSVLFASSVLPLHELIALRPDLRNAKKILYFHENQLIYPVRKSKERDFQYGYNQILSCLVADVALFNSNFNRTSFLDNISKFFKLQPDFRPKNIRAELEAKCSVFYFPMKFSSIPNKSHVRKLITGTEFISIVWPHRWEFDKNPDLFFRVMFKLVDAGHTNFRLHILGESFKDNPLIFEEARQRLKNQIATFGYVESKEEFYNILLTSDLVVSTSDHEFFGVSIVEAIYCGCYPLCPSNLVYPEILEENKETLFTSEEDLYAKLKRVLEKPHLFVDEQKNAFRIDLRRFDWFERKAGFFANFQIRNRCD